MPFDASGTFTRIRGADSWKGDATANTPIRADLHDTNDNDFAQGLSDCITKNGKTQPTADLPMAGHKLTNLGAPTASSDSATKQYVDNAIAAAQSALQLPPGVMMPYGKSGTVPTGWLYCNGALVSRATYATLFGVIGTTFGAGDGVSTFQLPDFRGRFARGWADNQTILDSGRVFGSQQAEGFKSHAHTATSGSESADHTHGTGTLTIGGGTHTHSSSTGGGTYTVNAGSAKAVATADDLTLSGGAHGHTLSGNTGGRSAAHNHAITVDPIGDPETRPANLAVVWIIKT